MLIIYCRRVICYSFVTGDLC